MQKIIDFAYLRKCEITEDIYKELFAVADYFGIQSLLKLCTSCVSTILKPENCIGLIDFARFVYFFALNFPAKLLLKF